MSRCPFIDRSEELRSSPSRHLSLQIYVFSVKQPRVNHFFAQKRHISPLFWLISLRKWLVTLVFLGVLVILGVLDFLVLLGALVFLGLLAQQH